MGLTTDYRPKTLADIAGNRLVVKSLQAILSSLDTANHVFLFTGAGGTGKSTFARIVANALGVYDPEKNGNPSYQEINTSDLRGIDTVRDIIKISKTTPMFGSRRVFFLDECHQVSPDAQEAFLHLLENSNHSPNWFIFATTEPEKLKPTFKRRCTSFDLKPLMDEEMSAFLGEICKKANLHVTEKTKNLVIGQANGSCGMALAFLDKVKDLSDEDAEVMLTMSESFKAQIINLCRVLSKKQPWADVAEVLDVLRSEPPEKIRLAVLNYASNWLLRKDNAKAYLLLDAFQNPTYNNGFPQIVYNCYMVRNS